MAKAAIQSYRDLEVWQAAMDLTVMIYEQAARLPDDERYVLSSQIRRAGGSIPSNIAEGHSCGEDGRYIHHVRVALGSAGELSTELELIVRLKFATPDAWPRHSNSWHAHARCFMACCVVCARTVC